MKNQIAQIRPAITPNGVRYYVYFPKIKEYIIRGLGDIIDDSFNYRIEEMGNKKTYDIPYIAFFKSPEQAKDVTYRLLGAYVEFEVVYL